MYNGSFYTDEHLFYSLRDGAIQTKNIAFYTKASPIKIWLTTFKNHYIHAFAVDEPRPGNALIFKYTESVLRTHKKSYLCAVIMYGENLHSTKNMILPS